MRAKKLLSLLLVCVMLVGLFSAPAFAASYGDTQGHWAQAAIDRWSDYGIVTGDGQGFRPNDNMTRAEAATVFSRLFGLSDAAAKTTFTDVAAKDWFYEAVNKCVNAGIMNGVGDNRMNPNGTMTREMFFVMFARALGIKGQSTTKGLPADGDSWANGYINALTDRGYVRGMDGKVNALANINRASVMALLDQTIKQYVNASGTTTLSADKGVVLVNAKNVTLTGTTAADIVIAQGANGGNVDFVKATVTGAITAQAANAKITSDKDSKITTPVINGANTTYTPATTTSAGGGGGGGGGYYSGGGGGGEETYYNITAADGEGGGSGKTANDSADGISGVTFDKAVKITSAVGDGTVTLSNVTFQDNLIIEGGGSNSVKLINCIFAAGKGIIVNKSGGETPRIELTGTPVDSIKSETSGRPVIIEATDTASAVKKVESSSPITLQGKTQVTEELKTTGSNVTIASGSTATVEKLTTTGDATVTANGGTIKSVEPESGSVTVDGASQSAVQAVTTTGAAVTISTTVAKVEAKNADVTVAGGTVTEELKVESSSSQTASVTLSGGANVAKVSVSGDGTNNISSSGTDAGRIGEIATTASLTVNANNVTIDTIAVTAKDSGDTTTKTVTVAAGTVSTVNASAPTTVDGSGTVADLQANSPVIIASDAVKKVTVNIGDTVDGTGNVTTAAVNVTKNTGAALDVAVNTSADITVVVVTPAAANGVSVSAASDDVTVGEVKKGTSKEEATAVEHIHKWGTPTVAEATCTVAGSRTYTCVASGCTDPAATKTETIPALGHDWVVDTINPATCTTGGTITYKCTHESHVSTDTKEPTTIPVDQTAHSVASDAAWVKTDANYHWHACQHDNTHQVDKAKHTYVLKEVSEDGTSRTYACSVCGHEKTETVAATVPTIKGGVTGGNNGASTTEIMNAGARGYTSPTVTVKVTSTIDYLAAANSSELTLNKTTGAYENTYWSVGYGSTNLKVSNITISGKDATFTFAKRDKAEGESDTNYSKATYPARGTLKITALQGAFSGATDKSNTLMFTVPAVPDVTALEVNVAKDGTVTVAPAAEGETFTYYLVDSKTETKTTGEGDNAVTTTVISPEKDVTKYTVATESSTVARDLGTAITLGEGSKLPYTKANNGKYLVAVKTVTESDKTYLDAIGVSNALALIGETPAELKVAVDVVGKTTVKQLETTGTGEDAKTKWETVSDGITYYKVNKLPAFAWDTLITKTDLETSGGTYYLGAGENSIGTLSKSDVASDLYVIAVKFADGIESEKVVKAYGVSGKVVIKDIDDVIDEGIRAVNAKTDSYATLSLNRNDNVVTVAIKDGTKQIKPAGDQLGVYDDIINTLIAKLDAYKGPFQITAVGGQNGSSTAVDDLTLGSGEEATTASAITAFVRALFPEAAGDTPISTLAGKEVTLTLKNGSSPIDDGTYTLKFEAAEFKGALDQALNAQLKTINTAIKDYGKVKLVDVYGSSPDTVVVTITNGETPIGTVKTAVVDQLAAALTGFDTTDPKTWGTTTLSDARNASNELDAASAIDTLVTDFVAKLKYDDEPEHTLQSVVGQGIKGLDGKNVQIKVTSVSGEEEQQQQTKEATYTFTFTVIDPYAIVLDAISTANDRMKDGDDPYAVMYLNAARGDDITVEIPNNSTKKISEIDEAITAMIKGLITKNTAKIEKLTNSKSSGTNELTASATEAEIKGFVVNCFADLSYADADLKNLNEKTATVNVIDKADNDTRFTITFKSVENGLSTVSGGLQVVATG